MYKYEPPAPVEFEQHVILRVHQPRQQPLWYENFEIGIDGPFVLTIDASKAKAFKSVKEALEELNDHCTYEQADQRQLAWNEQIRFEPVTVYSATDPE